jgi:hypothetical protein
MQKPRGGELSENELATLLGVDRSLAADLIFAAPDDSAMRILQAWRLATRHFDGETRARVWLTEARDDLGGLAPIEIWLCDGFPSFEAIVMALTG